MLLTTIQDNLLKYKASRKIPPKLFNIKDDNFYFSLILAVKFLF